MCWLVGEPTITYQSQLHQLFATFGDISKSRLERIPDFFICDTRTHREFFVQCDQLASSWRLASRRVGKNEILVGTMPKFQNAWRGLSLILYSKSDVLKRMVVSDFNLCGYGLRESL